LKIHPNDLLLQELMLSLSQEQSAILDHLFSCESCRRRARELRDQPSGSTGKLLGWSLHAYDKALERSLPDVNAHSRLLSQERAEAPALFVELMQHPEAQRSLLLTNDPRFRTWGLFELLIERTQETAGRDALHAEEMGRLALRLSEILEPMVYDADLIEDLRGRAWIHIGNARRVRSDLSGSEEAFERADACLRQGTQDAVERAILLDAKSSLRRDQHSFDEAVKLTHRAVSIFLQHGHRHQAGRSLVKMSTIHHMAGRIEAAMPLLYQALELIDAEEEPRLLLCARHNLIDNLAEMGRFLEAQKLYRDTRPLYRDFPDGWIQNRRKWVRGKIAKGLGQTRLAESLFEAARNGFLAEGIPYDTALVSLELATLYAEQSRMADLRRLVREIVPIFSSLGIHREALAALACLKQVIEAERVSPTS
jgi:tetratricopeptide (TPR) repeat protein